MLLSSSTHALTRRSLTRRFLAAQPAAAEVDDDGVSLGLTSAGGDVLTLGPSLDGGPSITDGAEPSPAPEAAVEAAGADDDDALTFFSANSRASAATKKLTEDAAVAWKTAGAPIPEWAAGTGGPFGGMVVGLQVRGSSVDVVAAGAGPRRGSDSARPPNSIFCLNDLSLAAAPSPSAWTWPAAASTAKAARSSAR